MCNTPTMTAISGFLTGLAQEYIIFSGDVKSTTIAIAITSSLCCSIVWLVVHLVSGEQPEKEITKKSNNHSNSSSHSNRVSMVTFHLRRSNSMVSAFQIFHFKFKKLIMNLHHVYITYEKKSYNKNVKKICRLLSK